MIVYFFISGGTLFFAGIFFMLLLQGIASQGSTAVISFLENNLVVLTIIWTVLTILGTYFITKIRKEADGNDSTASTVAFVIGLFLVLAQIGFVIYTGLYATFEHNYGAFLKLFEIIIYIVVLLIDIILSIGSVGLSITSNRLIIVMYIMSIVGVLLFGDINALHIQIGGKYL